MPELLLTWHRLTAESLERLRQRTQDTATRPAGSTALVDADIPPADHEETSQEPGGQPSASWHPGP